MQQQKSSDVAGNGLTGTTLRTEVPQHGNGFFALLDLAFFHSLDKSVFSVERPRFSGEF
jgi:hypothetical protein